VAREPGIRERDDCLGVLARCSPIIDVVDPGEGGHDGDPADLDVAVGGAQHEIRGEPLVVQPTVAREVEEQCGLTCYPTHLWCREGTGLEQLGEGMRVVEGFLDDVGEVVGRPDIEDPREPGVLKAGGAAGSVEEGIRIGMTAGHGEQGDSALEDRVASSPALGAGIDRDALIRGIPPAQDAPWSDPLHCSSSHVVAGLHLEPGVLRAWHCPDTGHLRRVRPH